MIGINRDRVRTDVAATARMWASSRVRDRVRGRGAGGWSEDGVPCRSWTTAAAATVSVDLEQFPAGQLEL